MSFKKLAKILDDFDAERNWHGLDPADLAKGVMLEAAELLEHFQWDNSLHARGKEAVKDVEEMGNEAADVLIYLMKFCRESNIDLAAATLRKLEKVAKKYPPKDYSAGDPSKTDWGHEEYLRIKQQHRGV